MHAKKVIYTPQRASQIVCTFIFCIIFRPFSSAFNSQPPAKKGRRSILDLEPLVQTECQMDEMKKKIKDLTEELLSVRGHKVEVEKVSGKTMIVGQYPSPPPYGL